MKALLVKALHEYGLFFSLIICFTSLFGIPVSAQLIRKPLRILTTRDGLPQSFISGLAQDPDGFVWIGTRSGLARYDSRQFTTFYHRRNDSTSLSSDVIISLLNDQQGHIWIEHESGDVDELTPRTQRINQVSRRPLFRRHPLQFARRGWAVDGQGRLWGTQLKEGVWCYDWGKKQIRHYTHQRQGLASDTVRGLLASKAGNIWLLSRDHISQLNPATGTIRPIRLPVPVAVEHLPIIAGGTVRMYERRNGELMWADAGQLTVFSPSAGRFRTISLPAGAADGLSWFYPSPDGHDYVTAINLVFQYDDRRGLIAVGQLNNSAQRTESMLIDQSGLIWLGTNATGIQQINPSGLYFDSHPNQLGFHPDLFDRQFGVSLAGTFDWPASDDGFRRLSYYLRSTYDRHNRLWVGLRYWAGYYDSAQQRMVLMPPIPTLKETPFRRLGISGMHFDSEGRLWTVDSDGYIAFLDSTHRAWTPWLSADELRRAVAPEVLPQDLMVDEQTVWVTSQRHGLIRIDRKTRQIRLLNQTTSSPQLPSNQLLGLQPDPTRPNLLWIGSYDGLICLDKRSLRSQLYTTAQGLPDNTIYSVIADDEGYLWLSTNKGLCRFHPRTHQLRTASATDGLPGDEFNRFHHLRLPDGRLAFGGTEGWTIFDPGAIQKDTFQPSVALTDLKINSLAVPVTPDRGLLPQPVNALQELLVPYGQSSLSLNFAGLEYTQPKKIQYRYQLEGYDEDWVPAGFSPTATYTQLPPGHYTLRVNATNTTGQWSRHVHTLSITVKPPWWRTNLAYLIYFLMGIALIRLYSTYRVNQERAQQRQVAQQREAEQLREVDAMKTQFFANITHEFRTPLTLILTPIEALRQELSQTRYADRLGLVERNAQQLLGLINQLMDLARLDAQLMKVTPVQGRPDEVVSRLVETFVETAAAKHNQLVYQSDVTGMYWFDPDKLERIVTNLVANALKFTPATATNPGTVTVTLQAGDTFQLSVSDTGIGIAAEFIPHLFDRFYRVSMSSAGADSPAQSTGTGIGLALVKELVELQYGRIRVESQPGRGTTIRVDLPYRAATDSQAVVESISPVPDGAVSPLIPHEPETALILLVEDNEDMAQFITQSLPATYQLYRAVDGQDGLEQARRLLPDLIISDVMMPRMNGYQLCQQLKADLHTNHIPILLLTAKVTQDNRLEGLSAGADDYLPKPFNVTELCLRVHNQLEQRRRLREWMRQQLMTPLLGGSMAEPEDAFLIRLYTQLAERLEDNLFGVEQLADELGLSRSQLHRKVKALTDMPPSELVRAYRMKRAADYLRQGYNSAETAYRVGFDSPPYFARCFREQFGISPTEYAQQL